MVEDLCSPHDCGPLLPIKIGTAGSRYDGISGAGKGDTHFWRPRSRTRAIIAADSRYNFRTFDLPPTSARMNVQRQAKQVCHARTENLVSSEQASGRLPSSTAAAVANEFLHLGRAEAGIPPIDQMKLQKLIFYAHAWHLAYGMGPLFENDIEAWPWGPVVRDVYLQTKDFGRGPVTTDLWEFGRAGNGFDVFTPAGVRDNLKPFISSVWNTLKNYTGVQLSNSTHALGEPWTIIAERLGTSTKPTIPNELIEEVFRGKLGLARSA